MLKKFTSLFYESDAPKPEATAKTELPAPVDHGTALGPVVVPAIVPRASKPPIAIPGQADPEMLKILEDAIEEANIPGFDYIEFRDVLANMSTLGLPEPKMFQAAFASAQIAKVDKLTLLNAIDFYIKVIETKATEFHDYVAGLEATDVSGKDQAISDLDKLIEDDAAKIQELTAAIQERRKKQDDLRMEKAQADLDIKNKTAAFEATKATVIDKLTSDRNKIDTYIQ